LTFLRNLAADRRPHRALRLQDACTSSRRLVVSVALISFFSGLCLILSGCAGRNQADVIAAGSTSVQPFAEILAEGYMKLHRGVNIDVQGGGSSAGILAASSGTADIGMSSRNLAQDEQNLWHVEIARDGLALIVNPANSVGALTLAQARQIYSGEIRDWDAFGGSHARIHVVAREDGSGTRSAFESLVMGTIPITTSAIVQDSNGAVRQVVASDPNAVGFLSLGLVDHTVKALDLDAVKATRQDVINGTYKLARPFLFVSKGEPQGQAKDFIEFTLSEAGKTILDAQGLITAAEPKTP
jgi:phosphate transport system substrate-binding protein